MENAGLQARTVAGHANSQEDLKSTISKASFVKDMLNKNYQSLTPAKHAQLMQGAG